MTLLSGKEPDLPKDPKRPRRQHVTMALNVGLPPKTSKETIKLKIYRSIRVMVIVWRLRGNIIRTAPCWVA